MENVTPVDNPDACNGCNMHVNHCVCESVKEMLTKTVKSVEADLNNLDNVVYVDFKNKKREVK